MQSKFGSVSLLTEDMFDFLIWIRILWKVNIKKRTLADFSFEGLVFARFEWLDGDDIGAKERIFFVGLGIHKLKMIEKIWIQNKNGYQN